MKSKDVAVGSIYGMFSRFVSIVCGFVIHVVFARQLGPELFGLYTLIISILVWVESGVSLGLPSVFRKAVSENKAILRPLVTSLVRLSAPYCLTIMLLFVVASPAIALMLNEGRLIALLIIASLDIPFFVMFATYQGVLNGHGSFLAHSALGALYAISRTAFMVAAVYLTFGVTGALLGNVLGSIVGLVLAYHWTQKLIAHYSPKRDGCIRLSTPEIKSKIISFGAPYLTYSLLASLLINMDIWFVKALTESSRAGDEVVGHYAAAYNLARVPYLLMTAITMTMFPAISNAVFEHRAGDAQELIQRLLRLVLIIFVPATLVAYSTADQAISLVFSPAFLPAAESFRILFIGVCAFSILLFFVNIIAAENKPILAVVISLLLLPGAIALNYVLINEFSIVGAAWATCIVSLIGMIASGVYVWRRFGPIIEGFSLLRISLASGCVYFVSRFDELYNLHLLVAYSVLAAVYGLMLLILRETDLHAVKSLVRSLWKPTAST